jgi:cell shape-determining protein MreC|tara:strand:- start:1986 stop:2231 length:246 start_codon:yes stop_codon:yes gene_type:complete
MFSLIQKILNQVRSFDALSKRVEKIEAKLKRFEKLADENESLWQFLDEQKEMESVFAGNTEDFQEEFADMMLRNMKPRGDA